MAERYSYSKLDVYKQCPFRFYLNYILGNKAYSDTIATEFGTAIHECEESIAKAIRYAKPIDYTAIKNDFIIKNIKLQVKYGADYFMLDSKSNRSYADKAKEYLTVGIYNLEKFMVDHPTYEIIGIEQRFNFKFNDTVNFNGAIDRVFKDTVTNTYLIQDIKSWAVPKDPDELTTPLQFVVYILAAKELWGADPEQITCEYYLPIVQNGLVQRAGTKNFVSRGLKKIDSLFEKINAKDYAPNNKSALCAWCPFSKTNPSAKDEFKYLCPYHSLYLQTTRNKFDICKSEYEWQGLGKHEQILEEYLLKSHA